MKFSVISIVVFTSLALLFSSCTAISWEFAAPGLLSADTIRAVIQRIHDMIDSVDPEVLYPAGNTMLSFLQVSQEKAVVITLRILTANPNRDFCYIDPNGGFSVRGRVLRAIWGQAMYMVGNLMIHNSAQYMRVASEMLSIEYNGDATIVDSFMNSTSLPSPVAAPSTRPLECTDQICWKPEDCYIFRTTLESGIHATLQRGGSLQSPNGAYFFSLEDDCSLSIKLRNGGQVWSNGVSKPGADCFLELQADGNLVVYDSNKNVIWAVNKFCSGPSCHLSPIFTIQMDRNAVLYHASLSSQQPTAVWTAVWSTSTQV